MFDIVKYLEKEYGTMPLPRLTKVKMLFNLAYNCQTGAIVELGTYHGLGTAALCIGAEMSATGLQVYTVDDFIDRTGWAGEQYRPDDCEIFKRHMKNLELSPILLRITAQEAGLAWKLPIGILFWDCGGKNGETMIDDVMLWEKHILDGGHLYLHDTVDSRFGSKEAIQYLKGRYKVISDAPHVIVLRKEAI